MRLISAEECPCYICGATCPYANPIDDCKKFNNWIGKPAYDAEKVMEELDNIRYGNPCEDAFEAGYDDAIDEAIDIVKRGGVENGCKGIFEGISKDVRLVKR